MGPGHDRRLVVHVRRAVRPNLVQRADAFFEGTAGTVTVSGTISSVNSLHFNVDGYTLNGGAITLTGSSGSISTVQMITG